MVNLELYRVFYAVVRRGSLTKAAEELHISQSAVSQAVKQLEAQLGAPLFDRRHKGMELTEQGGALIFADVERALQLLDGAELKIAELNGSAKGTLRIGASATIFQYALADKIVEYNRLYPQVKIELISDVSPRIIEAMKANKCDVGFLNLPTAPDSSVAIVDSIKYLHDIFIAGAPYFALQTERLSPRDLRDYPLLIMEERTVARDAFERYTESHGVKLVPSVEIDNWGFMKQLVAGGMGIGCIPREYVQDRLRDGTLLELNVDPAMPTRSVGMALAKNVKVTFALRAFIDLFKNK